MSKNILVFGGGHLQISLIEQIKKLGFSNIVIDPDSNVIGKQKADYFLQVDGDDLEKTLEISRSFNISGIVTTATDKPILMMSKIAKELNLPFPSYESCLTLLDKSKFKDFLSENNIPHANGRMYQGYISVKDLDLKFPVITKPVKNSGSRGVIKVNNENELENAIIETLRYSEDERYLIEEFIDGDEISVEGLVQNGKVHIIQITDKIVTAPPYNVELGHIQPSKYYYLKEEILNLLQKIVDKIGLDNCGIHPELKIKDGKLMIIEIGPRLGGDFITSHLTPLSTNVNIEKQLIRISLSLPVEYNIESRSSLISYFNFAENTRINGYLDENELYEKFPHLYLFNFELKKGELTKKITNSNDRYGYFILKGESREEIISIKDEIYNFIKEKLIKGRLC